MISYLYSLISFSSFENSFKNSLCFVSSVTTEFLLNFIYNPIKANFSKIKHCVEPFEGNRYSLVFYTLKKYRRDVEVPPPSIKYENKQYVFYRGDKVVNKKNPLPHPLRKKKANPDSKPQQESL